MKPQFLFSCLCLSLLFLACEKRDVNDYKGDPGTAGSNEQVRSFIMTIDSTNWVADTIKKRWTASLFTTEVTDRLINEGAINVSIQFDENWYALPYAEGDSYFNYSISKQFIHVFNGDSHGAIPDDRPGTVKIKYVAISN